MIYNVISIIILCLLTVQLLVVLLKIFFLNRQDRILYVKGYKKGKCAYVYLMTIPLMLLGFLFDGIVWYRALFEAINSVATFAFLQFNVAPVINLINSSIIYEFTVYYSFTLICLNTIMFAFSLLGQFVFEGVEGLKFSIKSDDKLYVLGYNENSLTIYFNSNFKSKVIVDNFSSDDKFLCYVKKVNYLSVKNYDDIVNSIYKKAIKSNDKINVVINTQDDETNVNLCKKFINLINGEYDASILFDKLNVLVYGNNNYESLYQEIEKNAKGIIRYVNKYKLIANDFIKNYPISRFLDQSQLDYKKATVKDGVDINFSIIGFGKTGIQLFLSSIENNQFITEKDGEIQLKKVNYYLYDQTNGESSKLLNHTYFRYADDFDFTNESKYLPLPPVPANHLFYKLNVNDTDFYKDIKVTANKNSVNLIAVTLSNDLENIDVAKKLLEKMREWGIPNYYLFVKIRNGKNNYLVNDDDKIFIIGNEEKIVYDIDSIINDQVTKMAIKRNAVYDLEYLILNNDKNSITDDEFKNAIKNSRYNWYALRLPLERNSNYSAVLSIRGKLNLIGYDLVLDKDAVDEYSSFINDYSNGDKILYADKNGVQSKKIVHYEINNFKQSLRQNFAILEHFRWNSFMLANGFIPPTIDEIKNSTTIKNGKVKYTNGKDYLVRKHGNLTTFKGLELYSQIISQRDNISLEKADVIRYDYQILDDVGWLISDTPYRIIKK